MSTEATGKMKNCPFCNASFGGTSPGCVHMLAMASEMSACENWNVRPIEEALRVQLAEMRETLEFYASPKNWQYPGKDFHNFMIAKKDLSRVNWLEQGKVPAHTTCGGKRAREVLEKHKEQG